MKRIVSVILCVAAVCLLAGCGSSEIVLENHDWQLQVVQSNEDGAVIACGPESREEYPDATVVDVECSATAAILAITDKSDSTGVSYRYEVTEKDGRSVIYKLTGEDGGGMAVTSVTAYDDGREIPTLVVTLDGYTLYFQANE